MWWRKHRRSVPRAYRVATLDGGVQERSEVEGDGERAIVGALQAEERCEWKQAAALAATGWVLSLEQKEWDERLWGPGHIGPYGLLQDQDFAFYQSKRGDLWIALSRRRTWIGLFSAYFPNRCMWNRAEKGYSGSRDTRKRQLKWTADGSLSDFSKNHIFQVCLEKKWGSVGTWPDYLHLHLCDSGPGQQDTRPRTQRPKAAWQLSGSKIYMLATTSCLFVMVQPETRICWPHL